MQDNDGQKSNQPPDDQNAAWAGMVGSIVALIFSAFLWMQQSENRSRKDDTANLNAYSRSTGSLGAVLTYLQQAASQSSKKKRKKHGKCCPCGKHTSKCCNCEDDEIDDEDEDDGSDDERRPEICFSSEQGNDNTANVTDAEQQASNVCICVDASTQKSNPSTDDVTTQKSHTNLSDKGSQKSWDSQEKLVKIQSRVAVTQTIRFNSIDAQVQKSITNFPEVSTQVDIEVFLPPKVEASTEPEKLQQSHVSNQNLPKSIKTKEKRVQVCSECNSVSTETTNENPQVNTKKDEGSLTATEKSLVSPVDIDAKNQKNCDDAYKAYLKRKAIDEQKMHNEGTVCASPRSPWTQYCTSRPTTRTFTPTITSTPNPSKQSLQSPTTPNFISKRTLSPISPCSQYCTSRPTTPTFTPTITSTPRPSKQLLQSPTTPTFIPTRTLSPISVTQPFQCPPTCQPIRSPFPPNCQSIRQQPPSGQCSPCQPIRRPSQARYEPSATPPRLQCPRPHLCPVLAGRSPSRTTSPHRSSGTNCISMIGMMPREAIPIEPDRLSRTASPMKIPCQNNPYGCDKNNEQEKRNSRRK